MLEMLKAQAESCRSIIEVSNAVLTELKKDYDESVLETKQELSVAKRMLKSTNAAIMSLGGEIDEQFGNDNEQSSIAEETE